VGSRQSAVGSRQSAVENASGVSAASQAVGLADCRLPIADCRGSYLIASQLFWMSAATSAEDLPPTRSIMPVQKAPAPILPGIRSEPSKRKVEALARISPCLRSASLA